MMGNIHGTEADPSSLYSMEYISIKTLLRQMDTASKAVIQTLTSQKHAVATILQESDGQSKKKKNPPSSKISIPSEVQAILDSLEKGGVLQMQSICDSLGLMDNFIQSVTKNHFSDSVYRLLEEKWKKQQTGPSIGACSDDQVPGRVPCTAKTVETRAHSNPTNKLTQREAEMQQHVAKLEAELSRFKETEKEYLTSYNEQLQHMNDQNEKLQTKVNDLVATNESLLKQTDELKLEAETNHAEMTKRTVSKYEALLQEKHAELCSKDDEMTQVQKQLLESEGSNNKLQDDLKRLQNNNDLSIQHYQRELSKTNSRHLDERNSLKKQIEALNENVTGLGRTVHQLRQENTQLREALRKKKELSLQVCYQRGGGLLGSVAVELQQMVKSQCQMSADTDLILVNPETPTEVKQFVPTLVLVINASRLGTDVSNALQGLQCGPDIAIVVLHHKAKHALPNQSSDRVLTAPEYKQFGGIFDMAFLSGQGLYTCDMNSKALSGIIEFLKMRKLQLDSSD